MGTENKKFAIKGRESAPPKKARGERMPCICKKGLSQKMDGSLSREIKQSRVVVPKNSQKKPRKPTQ